MHTSVIRKADAVTLPDGSRWFVHDANMAEVVLWPYSPIEGKFAPHARTISVADFRSQVMHYTPNDRGKIVVPALQVAATA